MNTRDLLTSTELATAAGITFRQLDHWTNQGAIEATNTQARPGKGSRRRYHPNLVDPLRTVAALYSAFSAGIPTDVVAAIVDHHAEGQVDLGRGLILSWRAPRRTIDGRLDAFGRRLEWTGPRYLTDAECDRLLHELEAEAKR